MVFENCVDVCSISREDTEKLLTNSDVLHTYNDNYYSAVSGNLSHILFS
jgi:hypothetical protein